MVDKNILQLLDEYETGTVQQAPAPRRANRPPRTDRNNNPIAVIDSPVFTKHVKSVPVSRGDKFPKGQGNYHTAKFATPEEGMVGAREILSSSPEAIQWYSNHTGSDVLAQYGVQSPEDFSNLEDADQYAIIQNISGNEVSDTFPAMDISTLPGRNKTIEDAMAEIPDDIFKVDAPQEGQLPEWLQNIGQSQQVPTEAPIEKSGIFPSLAQEPGKMPGIMGASLPTPDGNKVGSDIASLVSMLVGGPALKGIVGGASKIPAVANVLSKSPKALTALKTAAASLVGGTSAGGISAAGGGDAGDIATAATIGAALPIGIQGIASSVKAVANKVGDVTLGKWNVGKFVNEQFGRTKNIKSLQTKNSKALSKVELELQNTLNKYSDNVVSNEGLFTENTIKSLRMAARRADDETAEAFFKELSVRMKAGPAQFTPAELNIVKRGLYKKAYSYKGDLKTAEASKVARRKASSIRQKIEDVTGEEVIPLNELESNHAVLSRAIATKMNKNPSQWSLFTKLIPIGSISGGATAIGGPVVGAATAGAGMAAQTVPGFTSIGAAGQAASNPEIQRIISTLFPQLLVPKGGK